MSKYNDKNNRRKRRSLNEKIGFYTALSICLVAICMAVYSTYNTLSLTDKTNIQDATDAQPVNKIVTGVQETTEFPTLNIEIPTALPDNPVPEITTAPNVQQNTENNSMTALQTMLSTDLSLTYPLKSNNVIREYSEKSVYFKTLNVWKPHKAVDFSGELGDDVCSMSNGAVTDVYEDAMLGKTVEISINDAVCIYSGLGSVNVKKGDSVNVGSKIGVIGAVPSEATDENHIHIQVKVNGKYADPLSFIGNNE